MRRLPVAVAAQHHLALCGRGRQAGCDKVLGSVEPDAEEMDAVVAALYCAPLPSHTRHPSHLHNLRHSSRASKTKPHRYSALRTCVASRSPVSVPAAHMGSPHTADSTTCLGARSLLIRMLPHAADGVSGALMVLAAISLRFVPPTRGKVWYYHALYAAAVAAIVLLTPEAYQARPLPPSAPPAPLYCTALTLAIPGTGPHLLPDRRRDCRLPLPGAVPQPPHNHTSRLAPHTDNAPHAP